MPDLSVVVPTLNEAETIESCLDSIGASADVEVIVSDGGSGDATLVLAEARGARIVEGSAGRGGQLNRGAAAAGAGRLLFLHADCRLPSGWSTELSKALSNPAVALACFYLRTEPADGRDPSWVGGLWLRTLDLRSRGGRLPYGDQAFGVRREVFDAVGGFPDIPLMEDLVFARACSRVGRLVRIPREVRTTDRRTMRQPVRARVMHLVFPWLLGFGISPATLAQWYGNPR